MNKGEFVEYISKKYSCSKVEAEKVIDMFTGSVISSLRDGKEISLLGFGSFTINRVEGREGRNPSTGKPMKIEAFNQVRFKVGQKLKDACNK